MFQKLKMEMNSYEGTEPFIFISYSHQDVETVSQFLYAMKDKYRFWYDEGIRSGEEWVEVVGERISECAVFLVFLSSNAQKSRFIADEIHYAYKYAKQMMAVYLEPIQLNRQYEFILDRFQYIRAYDDETVQTAIGRLLSDLPKATLIQPEQTDSEPIPDTEADEYEKKYDDSKGTVLGRGGLGLVHTTKGRKTGAEYAVKVFYSRYKANARLELQNMILFHDKPYTPYIIDYFENEERFKLVMTRIDGIDLGRIMSEYKERITVRRAVTLVYRIAGIIREIHDEGMVFGDIKPANFMMNYLGHIYLVDMDSISAVDDYNYLRVYTPRYAAPEQVLNTARYPDIRFDIYALGIVFRELMEIAGQTVNNAPSSSRGVLTDDQLARFAETIWRKMSRKEPDERYSNMGEVISAMELLIDWDTEAELTALYLPHLSDAGKSTPMPFDPDDTTVPGNIWSIPMEPAHADEEHSGSFDDYASLSYAGNDAEEYTVCVPNIHLVATPEDEEMNVW